MYFISIICLFTLVLLFVLQVIFFKSKNKLHNTVCFSYSYDEDDENKEVSDKILVRENGEKWREPFVEIENE